jgi:hypothetical protein
MSNSHNLAISPRDPREFCFDVLSSEHQRAQGMPGARRTRSLVCSV